LGYPYVTVFQQYEPLVAIVSPIIGALIGAAVTYYFVVKRKRVTFYVGRSEDLTLRLRQHQSFVVFKLNNKEVSNLNRAIIESCETSNFLFKFQVPFFNPKEEFDINLFFDGTPDNVVVHCRMDNVACSIRDIDYLASNTLGAAILRGMLKGLAGHY
jgi:hypothetical protein